MKSFLEEYGFAILAAIVVILLIAMCTPVGSLIKQQVMNVVDSFASRTESKLAVIDQTDVQYIAEEDAGKCKVTILTVPSATDKYTVRFRVNGGEWAESGEGELGKGGEFVSEAAESKQKIEFEIYDVGTKALIGSNFITVA